MNNLYPTVAQGWQCPLCKTVYAPSLPFCNCAKNAQPTVSSPTTVPNPIAQPSTICKIE